VPGAPATAPGRPGACRGRLRGGALEAAGAGEDPRQEPWGAGEALAAVLDSVRAGFDYSRLLEALEPYPRLRALAERYPGLRPGRASSLYEALVDSVVKQRITLRAALRVKARLVRLYGARAVVGGFEYYSHPLPERLARARVGGAEEPRPDQAEGRGPPRHSRGRG
jgi:3-methyladenine DNA glycosylase/8-oxoguanine DNA glycosylase